MRAIARDNGYCIVIHTNGYCIYGWRELQGLTTSLGLLPTPPKTEELAPTATRAQQLRPQTPASDQGVPP